MFILLKGKASGWIPVAGSVIVEKIEFYIQEASKFLSQKNLT
jgi:hypothetical protein